MRDYEARMLPLPEGGYKESDEGLKVNTRLNWDILRDVAFATPSSCCGRWPTTRRVRSK